MNYQKIYDDLIESRKNRELISSEYYESHHIIPKSMGGSNLPENLVKLTAREHFIAHWLLWRIHRNSQMARAFFLMAASVKSSKNAQIKQFSSIAYAEAKKAKSLAISELNRKIKRNQVVSSETRKKLSDKLKGRCFTEQHKEKIKNSLLNKPKTESHRNSLSKSLKGYDWSKYSNRNSNISKKNSGKNNGRSISLIQYDTNMRIVNSFDTLKSAHIYITLNYESKISFSTFKRKIEKDFEICGYLWKY